MSYDPTQPTPVDVIRAMARDTNGVVNADGAYEGEILQDAEYVAVLGQFGVATVAGTPTDTAPFYRAAASLLRQVATSIEQDPSSISAPKDGSIGYSNPTQSLRDQAKLLEAKADALDAQAEVEAMETPIVSMYAEIVPGPCW